MRSRLSSRSRRCALGGSLRDEAAWRHEPLLSPGRGRRVTAGPPWNRGLALAVFRECQCHSDEPLSPDCRRYQPMSSIDVGMDGHKESITAAVLPAGAAAPIRVDRLANDEGALRRYLARLATDGPLQVCYEASGAGFVRQRALTAWGYACTVMAPSLIPTKPGVQRKHGLPRVGPPRTLERRARAERGGHLGRQQPVPARARAGRVELSTLPEGGGDVTGTAAEPARLGGGAHLEGPASPPRPLSASGLSEGIARRRRRGRPGTGGISVGGDAGA